MSETTWLSDLFAASDRNPIRYEGRLAHAVYRRPLSEPTQVELAIRSESQTAGADLRQGVRLALAGGELEVFGEREPAAELWSDYAPRPVTVTCLPSDGAAELAVWNIWEHGGLPAQWSGQAGMLVEESAGEVVLRCSNGLDQPTFDDPVVALRFRPAR